MPLENDHWLHPDDPAAQDALKAAFREQLAGVLTEPLKVTDLAGYWGVHRSNMPAILKTIDGAEPCGRRWRVPVFRMPERFLQERDYFSRQ